MRLYRGIQVDLDQRYIMKIAENTREEAERLAAFNSTVHQEDLKEYIFKLFFEHPRKNTILWFYIEEKGTNQIVSGLTLLPLEWNIMGMTIKVAELGFVGTLKEFRGEGLFRKLNVFYEEALKERAYNISALRGIPYYYRRLDYEFVLPLNERVQLLNKRIPTMELNDVTIRPATNQDIPLLENLYKAYQSENFVTNRFEMDSFEFKYMNPINEIDDFKFSTFIISDGHKQGFFTLGKPFVSGPDLLMVSDLNYNQMIKVFQFLRDQKQNHIVVDQNFGSPVSQLAISLGAQKVSSWGWQLKIVDLAEFFKDIRMVLEKRLEDSVFAGISRTLYISNYHNCFEIEFKMGKILNIQEHKQFPDRERCDLRIPGTMLLKLLLGERSVDEIRYIITDSHVKPASKLFVETLFPKSNSFPDTYY